VYDPLACGGIRGKVTPQVDTVFFLHPHLILSSYTPYLIYRIYHSKYVSNFRRNVYIILILVRVLGLWKTRYYRVDHRFMEGGLGVGRLGKLNFLTAVMGFLVRSSLEVKAKSNNCCLLIYSNNVMNFITRPVLKRCNCPSTHWKTLKLYRFSFVCENL